MSAEKKYVKLPDGSLIPQLGQGTWRMGEEDRNYKREIEGLRHGIDLGMSLIDTAEMYADGKAENIAGHAISPYDRKDIFLVSKVYPENACRSHIYSSAERSLKLLGTDYLDIYLLHWRGDADLSEVVYCMEDLKEKGTIRRWGVSNFDVKDMEDLWNVPDGKNCCINQVLYNLATRGIEFDLLPWQRDRNIPFMAYSPAGQAGALTTQDGVSKAGMMSDPNVRSVALWHNISVVQVLLAFVMRYDDMIAIPKAVTFEHVEENALSSKVVLTEEDLFLLNTSFPAPVKKVAMEKY
jgi:diketogulonate reductase-like aldo/keto reductase